MRTYTIGDFKANLSEILDWVREGESIALAYGQKKEIVAYLVPRNTNAPKKRELGLLANKGKISFRDDFKMTESELFDL
jgi:antitoxin (DNA-binding transcriptional repressor) of toxin-antitoxin stability system